MTNILENVKTENLHILLVPQVIGFLLLPVTLKMPLDQALSISMCNITMYIYDTTGYRTSFHRVPPPEILYRHVALAVPVVPEQPVGTV